MIACVDVDYRGSAAVAAAAGLAAWDDATPVIERVARVDRVAPYVPGAFYLRELPCILAVLDELGPQVDVVVIDGYVWLAKGRPGLGARLHEALGRSVAVVGVAKTAFRGNDAAVALVRGRSTRPLFVTARGLDVARAVEHVRAMHGDHRLPSILKRVDRLAREG